MHHGDGEKFAVRYDVDVAVGKRLEPWITAAVRKFPQHNNGRSPLYAASRALSGCDPLWR